ncbi:MAG: helix-hairpin-helix domain-containing protein [Myxococcota bacterium]
MRWDPPALPGFAIPLSMAERRFVNLFAPRRRPRRVRHGVVAVAALLSVYPRSAEGREFAVEIVVDGLHDLVAYQEQGLLSAEEVEALAALLEQPLELNSAAVSGLIELPGVTRAMARRAVEQREKGGDFATWDDFAARVGWNGWVLWQVEPFVRIGQAQQGSENRSGRLHGWARWRGLMRIENRQDQPGTRSPSRHESYLTAHAEYDQHWRAGVVVTYRQGIELDFNRDVTPGGAFVSRHGPESKPRLDSLYVSGEFGDSRVIVGSYTAGFAERLTFNTSHRIQPRGWYANGGVVEDPDRGVVRPRDRLFGLAATYRSGIPLAGVTITVFGSSNVFDLYQGDFGYRGAHEGSCTDDIGSSSSRVDYRCGARLADGDRLAETSDFIQDGQFRSERIYEFRDLGQDSDEADLATLRYQTIRSAYREQLAGGHASLQVSKTLKVGATAYLGDVAFRLDPEGRPDFSYSNGNGFPRQSSGPYGAVGTSFQWSAERWELGAEFARSLGAGLGHGLVVRVNLDLGQNSDLHLWLRRYGPSFVNPRANPVADPDEVFGARARSERGVRAQWLWRHRDRARFRTSIDYSQNPHLVFASEGGYETQRRDHSLDHLAVGQRVDVALSSQDRMVAAASLDDRVVRALDLRRESYSNGGSTCGAAIVRLDAEGYRRSDCATGIRWSAALGFGTTRLRYLDLYAGVERVWQDHGVVSSETDSGRPVLSVGDRIVLRARTVAWPRARIAVNLYGRPSPWGVSRERRLPSSTADWNGSLLWRQHWSGHWRTTARYGFEFHRGSPDGSSTRTIHAFRVGFDVTW